MRHVMVVLALAATALVTAPAAQAGGFCPMGPFTDGEATRVTMDKACFTPTIVRIDRGGGVTFVNTDAEMHAVGGVAGTFGDLHKELKPGDRVTYEFTEDGTFPYVCIYHPGMGGAVVVGDGRGDTDAAAGIVPPASESGRDAAPRESAAETTSPSAPLVPVIVTVAALAFGLAVLKNVVSTRRGDANVVRSP